MRYRLRTLLIVLAMLGVIFARMAYLKQKADSHRREAFLWKERLANTGIPKPDIDRRIAIVISKPQLCWAEIRLPRDVYFEQEWASAYFHEVMAQRYDHAFYRPWNLVSQTENR